jgi:stress-induced morphogen|tara:strand:- start:467 stop:805 length:339 start_codon:yes stop_codon:yes gene_type:complete
MKSNNTSEIENILKVIFTPTHLVVDQSDLVPKKFKILIVSSKFTNKSSTGADNDKEVYQALKEKIKIQKPIIEELDIATYIPSKYDASSLVEYKTYKYNNMLPNFSQRIEVL